MANFEVRGWNFIVGVTIQMKATEQYFPVVLFIMPYNLVWNLGILAKIDFKLSWELKR